jgi:hypothetical protein
MVFKLNFPTRFPEIYIYSGEVVLGLQWHACKKSRFLNEGIIRFYSSTC